MRNLVVILGDQLSENISSLNNFNMDQDVILMAEVNEEATYVNHHKKKLVFVFSCMRHFAKQRQKEGCKVRYITLDNDKNTHSLSGEILRCLEDYQFENIIITEPGEYRLKDQFNSLQNKSAIPIKMLEDNRFICKHSEFKEWAKGKKELVMEFFYRLMRKKTNLLMDNDKPIDGKWNFDKSNRNPIKSKIEMPKRTGFKPDQITQDVIEMVQKKFANNFGILENFQYAVTKEQAEKVFADFLENFSQNFGTYQDAMVQNEPFLFHSVVSFYINNGLLDPLTLCYQVEEHYKKGLIPIESAEGFIRQIIGWREFIRGIYWLYMPKYKSKNFLNANKSLPEFYWTGKTKMNCIRDVVKMTKENAYAHHIQRLMITGNFALLAGLSPEDVCEWYLLVYADAYEWVELPNTLGMALHGDGGIIGTKPYVSSGAYINRMSNYCQSCEYNVKTKTETSSCPFNYLYWNFLDRHQKIFKDNHRMSLAYRNLEKLSKEDRTKINELSEKFLESI